MRSNKNAPCPNWTEGDKKSRYHLWFAASSRHTASSGQTTWKRGIGRTRRSLLSAGVRFAAQGCIHSYPSPPSTKRRLSAQGLNCYFFPSSLCHVRIIKGIFDFVNLNLNRCTVHFSRSDQFLRAGKHCLRDIRAACQSRQLLFASLTI